MTDEAEIPKYYAGKKILVTGGTGFMGKMLIWKLLQSCSLLDTIYVLVRSKQGKTPKSRKDELFRNMMFDEFINNNSKVLEKVVFITGDVGEEGVGLSQHDRNILINGVSHVFHGAAILKMDADLKCAINVNTEGTLRMLQLAGQMKTLEAFVYISTAYCCCENKLVEEKLYPSKHNPYEVIRLVHWMDAELLEIITPKLIDPLPNTYTYSKRLTESIFPDFESKIPILIVARPTIVVPSLKEPVPGWDDNWNGPTGLFVAGGKGVLRMTTMKRQGKPNMVPVDIAINGIITLPWVHAKENPNGVIKSPQKVNVYNVGETEHSSHTWEELIEMGFRSAFKYPFQNMLWYPNRYNIFEDNFLVYKIKALFLHWLPAYVIDFIMVIMAQKPFLVRVCSKIQSGEKVLRYFGRREWTFANDKLLRIKDKMNDADKAIFPITMKALIDSQAFMDKAILFTRQYLCKENPNTIHSSKKKLKMLYLLDRFFLVVRYILLVKILMRMYYLFVRLIGDYQYQPHMKT